MLPRCLFPVPSVGGIAPVAMEVAQGKAKEDGGGSEGGAFALQGVKDLGRSVGKAGNFPGNALRPGRSRYRSA